MSSLYLCYGNSPPIPVDNSLLTTAKQLYEFAAVYYDKLFL